jgi:hypothetical protein
MTAAEARAMAQKVNVRQSAEWTAVMRAIATQAAKGNTAAYFNMHYINAELKSELEKDGYRVTYDNNCKVSW